MGDDSYHQIAARPNPATFFHHYPGGPTNDLSWTPLSCFNQLGGDGIGFGDQAGLISTPPVLLLPPWSAGSFIWDIPVKWKIGGGPTNSMNGWSQIFSIDANGTVAVEKFGKSVTRGTNGTVIPFIQ